MPRKWTGCGVTSKTRGKKSDHAETEQTETFWRVTVLETATRLRCARFFGKNEQKATEAALGLLAQRSAMAAPPPLTSDGHNGCGAAMLKVWGKVPPYKGKGPRPKRKQAAQGWQHLKVIKNKEAREVSAFCEKKVVFGNPDEVAALLGSGTVHLERSHLTMRNFDSRIARKGLGVSKKLEMHLLAAAWEDAFYNLCHPVRTLKSPLFDSGEPPKVPKFTKIWAQRTPMMAAQITDHIWTVKELLYTLPINPRPPTL